MKVLMQGKVDLFETGGGDRVQIENTAKELQKLGVEVEIKPGFGIDYSKYDVVHLFQLDWTPETYLYAREVKAANKPLVLSPIHHSIAEIKKCDDEFVFDFRRISKVLFKDQFKRDTLKNIYRALFDLRKVYPTFVSVVLGLREVQKMALELADFILVQTSLEAEDLKDTYDVDIKWKIVPNGVGRQFIDFDHSASSENKVGSENYILCIGRIEARKNQLSIIEAVDQFRKKHSKDTELVFVGGKSKIKHPEYIYRFDKKVAENEWIKYIGELPYEDMPLVYKYAKVCVSASWFETTGLSSIEALFCGANTVAAGDRAREFLGDYASYCQPDNINSIEEAIAKEYYAPRPTISDLVLKSYTWENAAKKTLEVYNDLITDQGGVD
jgi:glycosyltransferase involved in cell wall biosynthesis